MNEEIIDNPVVDNTSVDTSVDTSVVDTSVVEDTVDTSVVDTSVVDTSVDQQKNEQINFKALRQAKKQAEKERDELALRVKELSRVREDDPYDTSVDNTSDDDDIDASSSNSRDIKELKRQWTAQQNQLKAKSIEEKLKSEFPDLEEVVTSDNIEVLKARDPNFAKIINRAPSDPDELYHRAVAAHTLIKKYGIYVKDNHVKDRARVEKNMAKPRPASSASAASTSSEGLSDFSSFAGMNEDDRRQAIFKLARERADG